MSSKEDTPPPVHAHTTQRPDDTAQNLEMCSLPHDSSKGIEDTWSVHLKSLKPRHRIRKDRNIVINTVTFKMDEIMLNFTVSFFF